MKNTFTQMKRILFFIFLALFFKMVLPGEKVIVTSKKQYFRFGKLKCLIEMHNGATELVAKGIFSGIIKNASIIK